MSENYIYGTLIAKLLRDKITREECDKLDEWLNANPDNMKLLEALMNDFKVEWSKKWFKQAGVSIKGIKWRNTTGWYKRDKNMWDFYIVMLAVLLFMALVFYVIHYL